MAALLPVAVGATSVFTAFALLRAVNVALPLSVFALNLVIGLGLGLAVDYSLFLVSRFREELGAGRDTSLGGDDDDDHGGTDRRLQRGHGGARDVLAGGLPAALPAIDGDRRGDHGADRRGGRADAAAGPVRALRRASGQGAAGAPREGHWYRQAHRVLRHPGIVTVLTCGALVALSVPAFGTRWTGVDARVLPPSTSARQVEQALRREYPLQRSTPAFVAAHAGAADGAQVRAYAARLAVVSGVANVTAPRYLAHGTWQIDATLAGEAIAPEAQRAIAGMRALPAAFATQLGGSEPNSPTSAPRSRTRCRWPSRSSSVGRCWCYG